MPSSYTALALDKPNGATQAGTAFGQSIRDNEIALAIGIAVGELETYAYSQSVGAGDALRPDIEYWTSGTNKIRVTNTWGTSGGQDGNLTQRVIEWSTDSGSSWAAVKTITYTYDASGNLTATTNGGGYSARLAMLWGWIKKIAAHIAATGTAAHALGTMSTQAANAVAITGGTADLTRERETRVALGSISGSTAVDWSAGGAFTVTAAAAGAALTWSNLPAAGKLQFILIEITNGGVATSILPAGTKWVGPAVTFQASGVDVLSLYCHDGSTVVASGGART